MSDSNDFSLMIHGGAGALDNVRSQKEAVRYLEAAPHDFGGHKAAAIRDSRAAIVQLRAALAYRARVDR